jgi:hypothetical protein
MGEINRFNLIQATKKGDRYAKLRGVFRDVKIDKDLAGPHLEYKIVA